MAVVYKTVGGKKVTEIAALHVDAVKAVSDAVEEIATNAERLLLAHRQDGVAYIDITFGDVVDQYVELVDTNKSNSDEPYGPKEADGTYVKGFSNSALSIEYGRSDRVVEQPDGTRTVIRGHEGLFILHRAARLRAKRGTKKVK